MDMKAILNVVPTLQAASLVSEVSSKKKKRLSLLGYGTKAIIGTSLIKAESDIINS